jgi:hypothetical protein
MPKKTCHDGCECHKCKTTTKKKKSKPKRGKTQIKQNSNVIMDMRMMTMQPNNTVPSQFNTPKDILDIKNSLIELLQKEKKKLSGVISTQTEDMHEIVDDMATEKAINSIGKRNNNEYLKQSLNASLKQSSNKKPEVKGATPLHDEAQLHLKTGYSFVPDAEYFQSFNTSLKEMVDDMSIPPQEHIVKKSNLDDIFGYDEFKDYVIEANGGGYKKPEMAEAKGADATPSLIHDEAQLHLKDDDEMPGLIYNENNTEEELVSQEPPSNEYENVKSEFYDIETPTYFKPTPPANEYVTFNTGFYEQQHYIKPTVILPDNEYETSHSDLFDVTIPYKINYPPPQEYETSKSNNFGSTSTHQAPIKYKSSKPNIFESNTKTFGSAYNEQTFRPAPVTVYQEPIKYKSNKPNIFLYEDDEDYGRPQEDFAILPKIRKYGKSDKQIEKETLKKKLEH